MSCQNWGVFSKGGKVMPLLLISLLIQIFLVIHIIKTGRGTTWIWLVVILPVAGSVAYIFLELLPDFAGTKTGRKTQRKLQELVNPDKELKTALDRYSVSKTTENARRLAEELLKKESFEEAGILYQDSLNGVHATDPDLMYGLAAAEYGLQHFNKAKAVLDELIAKNPEYKNEAAHLLYARTTEAMGNSEDALHEYAVLHQYCTGPEASYHYAKMLHKTGKAAQALDIYEQILVKARRSGSYYNEIHSKWIKLVNLELRS
jgi:hypothetical protein